MPIEIDDNLLDAIGFKSDKNRDVYRGHGMTMEVLATSIISDLGIWRMT